MARSSSSLLHSSSIGSIITHVNRYADLGNSRRRDNEIEKRPIRCYKGDHVGHVPAHCRIKNMFTEKQEKAEGTSKGLKFY